MRGTVISVDAAKGRADLSLRSDAANAATSRGAAQPLSTSHPPADRRLTASERGGLRASSHGTSSRRERNVLRPALSAAGLADLKVGEVVTGSVRKVETFGVFVTVDGCGASGLCHISEVADERIKSLPARVAVGERVKAIVLKVDPEARPVSGKCSGPSCPARLSIYFHERL